MGGLGFLLVIFVYIFVTFALVILTPTLKFKALVLLAALLIPSADAIYGRIKLNQMCKADGGLRVYQIAHNVEGYMTDFNQADDYSVKNGIFKFSESEEKHGVCDRVSMQNGELVYERNVKPKSKYKANLVQDISVDQTYSYSEAIIESFPEGATLVRDRMYQFRGGWAERFLGSFADAGAGSVRCEMRGLNYQKLAWNYLKSGDK